MVSSWLSIPSVRWSIQKIRKKSRGAKANRHVVERRQLRHLQTHTLFTLSQSVYNCSAFCLCDASYGLHFITCHYNSRHTCKQSGASSVAAPLSVVWTARLRSLKVKKSGWQLFVAPKATERRCFKSTGACRLPQKCSSPTVNIRQRQAPSNSRQVSTATRDATNRESRAWCWWGSEGCIVG